MSTAPEALRDEVCQPMRFNSNMNDEADRKKGTRSQVVVAGAIAGLVSRYATHLSNSSSLADVLTGSA